MHLLRGKLVTHLQKCTTSVTVLCTFFVCKSAPSTVCFIICLLFTSIILPLKNRHYIADIITLTFPDESESFLTKSRLVCVVLVLVQLVDQHDLSGKDS